MSLTLEDVCGWSSKLAGIRSGASSGISWEDHHWKILKVRFLDYKQWSRIWSFIDRNVDGPKNGWKDSRNVLGFKTGHRTSKRGIGSMRYKDAGIFEPGQMYTNKIWILWLIIYPQKWKHSCRFFGHLCHFLGTGFANKPNNEFIKSRWKNYFYFRRKLMIIAISNVLNINNMRNNGSRHNQRNQVIIYFWWTRLIVFSKFFSRISFLPCVFSLLFFGHLSMLYTIILLSSPPYTCRLDSRNSFLSHPTPHITLN